MNKNKYTYSLLKKGMFRKFPIEIGTNQHCLMIAQTGALLLAYIGNLFFQQK